MAAEVEGRKIQRRINGSIEVQDRHGDPAGGEPTFAAYKAHNKPRQPQERHDDPERHGPHRKETEEHLAECRAHRHLQTTGKASRTRADRREGHREDGGKRKHRNRPQHPPLLWRAQNPYGAQHTEKQKQCDRGVRVQKCEAHECEEGDATHAHERLHPRRSFTPTGRSVRRARGSRTQNSTWGLWLDSIFEGEPQGVGSSEQPREDRETNEVGDRRKVDPQVHGARWNERCADGCRRTRPPHARKNHRRKEGIANDPRHNREREHRAVQNDRDIGDRDERGKIVEASRIRGRRKVGARKRIHAEARAVATIANEREGIEVIERVVTFKNRPWGARDDKKWHKADRERSKQRGSPRHSLPFRREREKGGAQSRGR